MRRLLPLATLGLLALAAGGCRTAGRLWRIAPFEGGDAGERVNLWPLAYHAGDATAVLWPIFDVDSRGFALRPLVAKEDSAWSVLWPLAAFDTEDGEGWVFPFYRFETEQGLFPLANVGTWSWIGPWWWTEESRGLFPLALLGSEFSYVGPWWWAEADGETRSGLFPVAAFGPTSYVGPAWWRRDGSGYGLLPLFGFDLFRSGVDHVGPVWWRPEGETSEWGLFPVLTWGDHGRSFSLFPLYTHELGPEARSRELLLGLGRISSAPGRRERWLLPLYYDRATPEKRDTVLLPFYWKHVRGESAEVYTLLGNRSVDPDSRTFNLYPLWWSNEDRRSGSAWRMLVPFFYFEEDGPERTLITPLGGRGWSTDDGEAFVNVLGPLYHHSRSRRQERETTAFLWPLYQRTRRGPESATILAAGLYARTRAPERSATSYAFWLGHGERSAAGRSHRLWPLYSWSDASEEPDALYRWTLVQRRRSPEEDTLRVFPLLAHAATPERSAWDALLGIVHHERLGRGPERVERSWVWPLAARSRGAPPSGADQTSLVGSASWPGGSHFQLGVSLLYSRRAEEDAAGRSAKSRALLLFTHEEEQRPAAQLPAAEATSAANRVHHEERAFLFGAFLSERSTYRAWRAGLLAPEEAAALRAYALAPPAEAPDPQPVRAILAAHDAAPAGDDADELRRALAEFGATHAREVEERRLRLPLLFGYERGEDALSWHGPLGLVRYARDAEARRFSLLYYGYRSETRAGRTRRDLFPFVTWDSGPDETSWSFLWRVLRYERKGERRGGHVLFVPWGAD
ncbi:MAG TPA: hypothetical protein VF530_03960 [Planctomycetota bacterium]